MTLARVVAIFLAVAKIVDEIDRRGRGAERGESVERALERHRIGQPVSEDQRREDEERRQAGEHEREPDELARRERGQELVHDGPLISGIAAHRSWA